jgi:hypothetical protein
MKPWVRTLMIVAGIMVMLILLIYTDPTSLREFVNEQTVPARRTLGY